MDKKKLIEETPLPREAIRRQFLILLPGNLHFFWRFFFLQSSTYFQFSKKNVSSLFQFS